MEQPHDFGDSGALQTNAHAEPVFAVGAGAQKAARAEFAEGWDRPVGAGRSAGETDHHIAVFVGIDIHVGVTDIEDGFGVAELEIQAAAANLDIRNRWRCGELDCGR